MLHRANRVSEEGIRHIQNKQSIKYPLNEEIWLSQSVIDFISMSVSWVYHYCFNNVMNSLRKKCPYLELFWFFSSRIRTEYGEIRTRITPNTDTFHAVIDSKNFLEPVLHLLISSIAPELKVMKCYRAFASIIKITCFN